MSKEWFSITTTTMWSKGIASQYFKEGRALRTETTVNDSYDFGMGRLLTIENWDALTRIGHDINERLLDAQLGVPVRARPDDARARRAAVQKRRSASPGLRFGDPRVMALLACLCAYSHLINGFTNRTLRALIAELLPGYGARQMTYDLRCLRRKGFICRQPRSQRYRLTSDGRRLAVFFTKTYTRILCPALAELDPHLPAAVARRSPIARSWRQLEHELDARIANAAITA